MPCNRPGARRLRPDMIRPPAPDLPLDLVVAERLFYSPLRQPDEFLVAGIPQGDDLVDGQLRVQQPAGEREMPQVLLCADSPVLHPQGKPADEYEKAA